MNKILNRGTRQLFFSCLIHCSLVVNGQNPAMPSKFDSYTPSPNSVSLGKFGDIPVSLYTGTPEINIPLYDITEGDIHVPILLSYHASGVKVQDVASWVGTNWALNAGGVITRTVKGLPDDGYPGFCNVSTLPNLPNPPIISLDYSPILANFLNSNQDYQPDLFTFNFSGNTGKFQLDNAGNVYMIPFRKINIQPTWQTIDNNNLKYEILSWTVTTEDGFKYIFDQREISTPYVTINNQSANIPSPKERTTSWYLTQIISPKGAQVLFEYTSFTTGVNYAMRNGDFESFWQLVGDPIVQQNELLPFAQSGDAYVPVFYSNNIVKGYYETNYRVALRLKKITFSEGTVEFVEGNSRVDLFWDKYLGEVAIKNKAGNLIKKFTLSYDNGARLFLSSITETGSDGILQKKPHVFSYYSGVLPSVSSRAIDYWGYYNGADSETFFTARKPNLSTSVIGTLKSIQYPTGGTSTFEYDLHDDALNSGYPDVNNGITRYLIGGLRIKRIVDNDPIAGKNITKNYSYKYDNGVSSGFQLALLSNYYTFRGPVQFQGGTASVLLNNYQSTPTTSLYGTVSGNHIGYEEVTVYHGEETLQYVTSSTNDNIKRVGLNGKTKYKFSLPASRRVISFPFSPISDDWKGGDMIEKTEYRYDKANTGGFMSINNQPVFYPVKKETFSYNYIDNYNYTPDQLKNIRSSRGLKAGVIQYINSFSVDQSCVFKYEYYDFVTGYKELTRSTETIYDPIDATKFVTKTTNYAYSADHLQRIKTESTTGDGKLMTEVVTYPLDYTDVSGEIGDLKNTNVLNVPIEKVVYKSNLDGTSPRVLFGTMYAYKTGGRGIVDHVSQLEIKNPLPISSYVFSNQRAYGVLPSTTPKYSILRQGSFKDKIKFDNYDYDKANYGTAKGNLIQWTPSDDVPSAQLWGYNNSKVIAQATNAKYTEIYHESFETVIRTGVQEWKEAGTQKNLAKTGRKVFKGNYWYITTGDFTAPQGVNLFVTYWFHDGTKWNFSGILPFGDSIDHPGAIYIDEIRVFPANAFMTTYTYDPLVGMTSETDINNKTKYYEYDALGRLSLERDDDGNILKRYTYQYKQ